MPTKRARLVPRRINCEMPEWAAHYLEAGEVPDERTDPEAWLAYLDWSVFREPVVGCRRRARPRAPSCSRAIAAEMPTKRVKIAPRRIAIPPAAIDAWLAGDLRALHRA